MAPVPVLVPGPQDDYRVLAGRLGVSLIAANERLADSRAWYEARRADYGAAR